MKRHIFISAAFLSVLSSAAQYTHPIRHFSFDYDENNWEIVPENPAKQPGADVDKTMEDKTLVTLQRKQADEKYRARFSVVVDDLKKFSKAKDAEGQLKGYGKHAVDFLKSQRFSILSTNARKLPQVESPALEVVANQRDFGLTFRQVIFPKGDEAFLLTAATRTNKFDAYEKETQKLMDSFHFATAKP